jgi:alkylhydroperoxidase family enzyme
MRRGSDASAATERRPTPRRLAWLASTLLAACVHAGTVAPASIARPATPAAVATALAGPDAHLPVLSDSDAWKQLPPVEEGFGQPLPAWIRALAGSLPKTAAAMIDLDYAQRMESPLDPRLRAELRWIAAQANGCAYAQAYARADYVRAGGAEDIDQRLAHLDRLPEAERLALELVRQLVESAYTVSDAQVARLIELYGEPQLVAIVLVGAYASFQDRLLSALGVSVEPNGPLPPVRVRFAKPAATATGNGRRLLAPPALHPPAIPATVDDPDWTAFSAAALEARLAGQRARRGARIHVPTWETVRDQLPPGAPRPQKPLRIVWSLVTAGYQPRLSAAWLGGLRAFRAETDLDSVYLESMFWVVTRSLQCFY